MYAASSDCKGNRSDRSAVLVENLTSGADVLFSIESHRLYNIALVHYKVSANFLTPTPPVLTVCHPAVVAVTRFPKHVNSGLKDCFFLFP